MHGDYTALSAPRRLRLLSEPPKLNDVRQGPPLLSADEVAAAAEGRRRFAFMNVWRPIRRVEGSPLACCDAATVHESDLITFQVPRVAA